MSGPSPTISIVVPMYNLSKYVLGKIASIRTHTFNSFKVALIDDHSTNNAVELTRSIDDPRIAILQNSQNSGVGNTRSAVIEATWGRYIAFLDGDDLCPPDKLERPLAFMQETGAAFIYTRYDTVDENGSAYAASGSILKKETYHKLLRHCFIPTSSIVYDVEKLSGKVYMLLIKKSQDFALFLRMLKRYGTAYLLDRVLCSYRLHLDGLSTRKSEIITFQWGHISRGGKPFPSICRVFHRKLVHMRSGSVVTYRKIIEHRAFGHKTASS